MKSIAEIAANYINKITQVVETNNEGLKGIMGFVKPIMEETALATLAAILSELDERIFREAQRQDEWVVIRKDDEKKIETVFGTLEFRRRYYRNRKTGETAHLLDGWLGVSSWQKVGDDVRESLVNEAVELSYQKSGEKAAPAVVSRTSVGRYIAETPIAEGLTSDGKKRKCSVLYVEADEDHVALQDGRTAQVKLVYVHEGNVSDTARAKLGHVRYVSWTDAGKTDDQWEKIAAYIEDQFDADVLETVWLCGDGAAWIAAGAEWLPKCKTVLDGYHINKAFMQLTSHASQFRGWGWQVLRSGTREQMEGLCSKLCEQAGTLKQAREKGELARYLLGHWDAIVARREKNAPGCSAEGHVSHVLSARLSSRPMGWGIHNMEKMAGLRVMRANDQPIWYAKRNTVPVCAYLPEKDSVAHAAMCVRKKVSDCFTDLPIIRLGKTTYLYEAIKGLAFGLSS
jgi:hypothetical protein